MAEEDGEETSHWKTFGTVPDARRYGITSARFTLRPEVQPTKSKGLG